MNSDDPIALGDSDAIEEDIIDLTAPADDTPVPAPGQYAGRISTNLANACSNSSMVARKTGSDRYRSCPIPHHCGPMPVSTQTNRGGSPCSSCSRQQLVLLCWCR
jgi:hypothetical protein